MRFKIDKMGKKIGYLGGVLTSLILISSSTPHTTSAQNRKMNSPIEELSTVANQDENYRKAESLFFDGLYPQALVEIKQINRQKLTPSQLSALEFYEAISASAMLKGEQDQIIEEFIRNTSNSSYKTVATVILAEEYLEQGSLERAGEAFKQVQTTLLPDGLKSRYNFYYGKYFFETKQYPEARYRLSQVDPKDTQYTNEVNYFLSYIKYQEKDFAGAMEGFEKLLNDKSFSQAAIYVAQIRFSRGDYQFIIDNLENLQSVAKREYEREFARMVGESYYNLSDYSNALKWLDKYRSLGGRLSTEHNYIMGYSYYMNSVYPRAIDHFTLIITGGNKMVQNAYYHLADSYLKIGDKDGALRAFSMAASPALVAEGSKEIAEDALYNHAKLSYETGSSSIYSQLIELMQRYINLYPQTPRAKEIEGYMLSIFINTSDYQNAINTIEKIKNPSSAVLEALQRMCYQQGIAKYNNQQYQEALELFERVLDYDVSPKYRALSYFWSAECQTKLGGKQAEIIDLFKKYIAVSTPLVVENQMAHYNIAYLYFNQRDWNQAQEWFDKFIDIHNQEDIYLADAYARLGDIEYGKRDYNAAVAAYDRSGDIMPNDRDYVEYQIALCYGFGGNNTLKIEQLQNIIDEDSSIYKELALLELASTYNKTNRYSLAEQTLSDFVVQRKSSPYYIYSLLEMGVATANQNRNSEALNHYKDVVRIAPESTEAKDALLAIKSIYVAQGDVDPYFSFIEEMNLDSDVDDSQREQLTFDALEQQYINSNYKSLIVQATTYLDTYAQGVHRNDVIYYLAESLLKQGREREALHQFNKLIELPVSQYTVSALTYAEGIYSRSKEYTKQYQANERLYELAVSREVKQRALESMMLLALERLADKQTINKSYRMVLADAAASKRTISLAWFAKGREAFEDRDYATASKDLARSKETLATVYGAQKEYMEAYILFSEKRYSDVEKFVIEFSTKGTPHQYWLAKSFILLGDSYSEQNDNFQAKATYQSIIEGYGDPNDGIIKEAQQKLDRLEQAASAAEPTDSLTLTTTNN